MDRVLTSAGGTLARNCGAQRFANGAGHWEVVITRAGGADVDEPQTHTGLDKQGISKAAPPSLHIAAENGHLKIARLLIEAGADVDKAGTDRGSIRTTPWQVATQRGHDEIALLLRIAMTNK